MLLSKPEFFEEKLSELFLNSMSYGNSLTKHKLVISVEFKMTMH